VRQAQKRGAHELVVAIGGCSVLQYCTDQHQVNGSRSRGGGTCLFLGIEIPTGTARDMQSCEAMRIPVVDICSVLKETRKSS
jgi:hypothetical protein